MKTYRDIYSIDFTPASLKELTFSTSLYFLDRCLTRKGLFYAHGYCITSTKHDKNLENY